MKDSCLTKHVYQISYLVNHLAELTKDHPVQVDIIISCRPCSRGMSMHSTGPLRSFAGGRICEIFVGRGLNVRPRGDVFN